MAYMFVLSLIIYPVVSFLSNPKRRWNSYRKSTGHEIALFLLFVIVFMNSMKSEKNYFQMMNATPHSSVEFIKKSFKQEAFTIHPDRNSSHTASEDYVKLVGIYKTLVNDKNREVYCRYGDLIKVGSDKVNILPPAEVLYTVFLNSFISLIGMFVVMLLYGQKMVNIPALLYELFCLAMEIYLRFTPDARHFMNHVPILQYYTIFELIAFCRSFRLFFMYYPNISEKEQDETSMKVGAALLRNNVLMIETLDRFATQTRDIYSSLSLTLNDKDVNSSDKEDINTRNGQSNSCDSSPHFATTKEKELITALSDQRYQRHASWNKRSVQNLLRQVDDATATRSSTGTWWLPVLSLLVSFVT